MEQTFKIIITSRENFTWQGLLITQQGETRFYSEMELLRELDKLIGYENRCDGVN